MNDHPDLRAELQALWHRDFPLSRTMDMRLMSFADHVLTSRSSLEPNTNVHGTAFAGSLYAIESLTAWGLLWLELRIAGLHASIIHASGNIEFFTPVREAIVARSAFAGREDTIDTLTRTGRVRLELTTEVLSGEAVASRFEGVYVVRLME